MSTLELTSPPPAPANGRGGATTAGASPRDGGEPSDRQVAEWLRGYADHGDPCDRERVILAHLELADRLAARYRGSANTSPDDLRQAARVGLIGAVDRFDVTRGTPFRSFAVATIVGELKRHLRDTTWSVHVPRTIKQHALELLQLRDRFAHRGDRWPALGDVAAGLDITREQAARAIQAAETRTTLSLDVPVEGEDAVPLGAVLPGAEPAMEPEDLLVLPDLVAALPAAERAAVQLYYFQDRTQLEIGGVLGCSQMQVSRLLRRALRRLRGELVGGDP
jgi:RNA polymerase sigma-B factor